MWADGNVEHIGPMSKESLIDEFGMQPRDLRMLDSHIMDVRPSLLVCKKAIILCSDPTNPLVSDAAAEEFLDAVKQVMRYLDVLSAFDSTKVVKNDSRKNFEFRVLESLLLLTVRGFRLVATDLQDRVYGIIPQLKFGVSPSELRDLLQSKRVVEDCVFSGRALQSAVSAVLSEDEDLVGMYLTDKAKGIQRPIEDHQNAELLLEYYERRLDEINESSLRLSSLLNDLDSNVSLTLASTRVRLQNLELQTAITTLALGAGTALAGFFGMNLTSGLESHPTAFFWATGAGCGLMTLIMATGFIRLLRARRSQLFLGSTLHHRRMAHQRHLTGPQKVGVGVDGGMRSKIESSGESVVDIRDIVAGEKKEEAKDNQDEEKEKLKEEEKKKGEEEAKKDGSEI
ncbi:mitochondrial inner membrane magnesium transporter mrs2 [Pseudohyphozyma bogoriensis]|nr:mitochondrial inner membrane magnesium transporter mrs2 [Pseudohyphozyma bogoriensis]